jgi:hypothetical protein
MYASTKWGLFKWNSVQEAILKTVFTGVKGRRGEASHWPTKIDPFRQELFGLLRLLMS